MKPSSVRQLVLATIFLFHTSAAFGQAGEDVQVLKSVYDLFEGMKTGDSALVHSTFRQNPTFITIDKDKKGNPRIAKDDLADFLTAVGTPHTESWNEVIWNPEVRIDGNLAQVWAPYAFYLGKKFSHCGVDAFHLFKGADGTWKTVHLADTRQRDKCEVPDKVSAQFK